MGNRTSNMRYKKGISQLPESGANGEKVRLEIELKIMADIGLYQKYSHLTLSLNCQPIFSNSYLLLLENHFIVHYIIVSIIICLTSYDSLDGISPHVSIWCSNYYRLL